MSEKIKRADRGAQRERVFIHKSRILEMLDQGARHTTVKNALGLDDIPRTTFQHLVKLIKKEMANRPGFAVPIYEATSPSPGPGKPPEESMKQAPDPVKEMQPERSATAQPGKDGPEAPRPRKRKYVETGVTKPENEERGYDPSKWKKLDI